MTVVDTKMGVLMCYFMRYNSGILRLKILQEWKVYCILELPNYVVRLL